MADSITQLQPAHLWKHFHGLTQIPRPSKKEERVAAWVVDWAKSSGFDARIDQVGNIVVNVPATPGLEGLPVVILQSHLDMVCEKNRGTEHDFDNDPIRTLIEGEWVTADGTTLGADNGIGVATMMAVASDPESKHGPLELLFTLDEETGLTGAAGFDPSLLSGKLLLNLDTEEDGALCIGCAGGADHHVFFQSEREAAPAGWLPFRVNLRGLAGGHSGVDIHKNRGNAIKLLALLLTELGLDGSSFRISQLQGGAMRNAIPRESFAELAVEPGAIEELKARAETFQQRWAQRFAKVDPGLTITWEEMESAPVISGADGQRLVQLLLSIPHGVQAMSPDLEDLVETSNCLAVVEPSPNPGQFPNGLNLRVVASSRSSVGAEMTRLRAEVLAAGRQANCEVATRDGYPGWQPNVDSKLLSLMRGVFVEVFEREPEVAAVHAGLECGLLSEKLPETQMVSLGPTITGAHSPDERVHIPSVARFWDALNRSLPKMASAIDA